MNFGRLLRGALILPAAFSLAAQPGFAAKPALPKGCCDTSCPTGKPAKSVPNCCLIGAVPDRAAVAVPATDAPVFSALLPASPERPADAAIHAVASGADRPSAGRDGGASSGLSPPRPA